MNCSTVEKQDDWQSDLNCGELERQEAESLPDREGTLDKLRNRSDDAQEATRSKDDPKVLEDS